jgi:flagellar motor component MotA
MNIFFYALIIFVIVYLVLNWFVKTSSKKIAKGARTLIIFLSIAFAVIMAYVGRFIFSVPFLLLVLPLIKTKAGLSLIQLFRIWSLLRILKRSGRFSFEQSNSVQSSNSMSLNEAYKILNLDSKKKYSEKEINKAHKKIISKVHPDISPETARLASIVNEARDTILKNL